MYQFVHKCIYWYYKERKKGRKFVIIGIDLGNYEVKTSESIRFLNKITKREKLINEAISIKFKNALYYLGEGEFQTDYNKLKKENCALCLIAYEEGYWGGICKTPPPVSSKKIKAVS